jgi:Xaa-Pro aminopeptidase
MNVDDAYDGVVKKARDAGIPVVAFNVDDSQGAGGNARMAYVGQLLEEAGYKITKELIKRGGLKAGDFVLLDMWAKLDQPGAAYYDITWTAFCGDSPSEKMREVFAVVTGARDAAIARVQEGVAKGALLHGFEVDDAARGYIESRGYGQCFTHRTGHSIGQDVHGNGANMDNFENHDERRVAPWTCFSIEPGVYLQEFGIRSEINMFVGDGSARVTGEIQRELALL